MKQITPATTGTFLITVEDGDRYTVDTAANTIIHAVPGVAADAGNLFDLISIVQAEVGQTLALYAKEHQFQGLGGFVMQTNDTVVSIEQVS